MRIANGFDEVRLNQQFRLLVIHLGNDYPRLANNTVIETKIQLHLTVTELPEEMGRVMSKLLNLTEPTLEEGTGRQGQRDEIEILKNNKASGYSRGVGGASQKFRKEE